MIYLTKIGGKQFLTPTPTKGTPKKKGGGGEVRYAQYDSNLLSSAAKGGKGGVAR